MKKQKYNYIKGAMSVFLIITFVANYLLAALLVDATRVHAAKTEVQSAAEIATENILTEYDEFLYDLYGLFAVGISEGEIESRVMDYMNQMVKLGVGGNSDLSTVMKQSALFDANLEKAWDPYKLEIDVASGSSVNLGQNTVLKSQIIDQMKYRAPVQLADSFIDFLDTVKDLNKVKEAIEEKKATDEKLQSLLDSLKTTISDTKDLKNQIINYCVDPVPALSSAARSASAACNFIGYMEWMDNKLSGIVCSNETDMNNAIDNSVNQFTDKMNQVNKHAGYLGANLDSILGEFNTVKDKISNLIKNELTPKKNAAANDPRLDSQMRENMKNIYQSDINSANAYIAQIEKYTKQLEVILASLRELEKYEFSDWNNDNSVQKTVIEFQDLINSIRYAGLANNFSLKDVVTEDDYSIKFAFWQNGVYTTAAGFFAGANTKLQKCLNAANALTFDEVEKEVQKKVDKEEKSFDTGERLKNIPKDANYKASTIKALDEYSKKNASKEMDNIFSKLTSLATTLGTDIRDNLYINEYIMSYFRNYVHHYQMFNDKTMGKDGYDKIVAPKFAEQNYLDLETTVAEVEYILIGSNSTAINLAGVYGEIMVWRLALNLLSVFMTPGIYQNIINIASAAGAFAPLVVLGLVLVTAATQAALDTKAIMEGKLVYVIRTEMKEWGINISTETISRNGGSGSEVSAKLKVGYSTYVRLMLLMMKQDTKLQRIGTLINMNMKMKNPSFDITKANCSVYADVSAGIDFMMLSPDILSTSLSQSGQYRFKISVNSAY